MIDSRDCHLLRGAAAAAAIAAVMGAGATAHAQNIERGRALYENHCQVCHKVDVHGRKNRTAIGIAELRAIVERWQASQRLNWSAEEIEDVVQFLSTTRYFFTTSVGGQGTAGRP